MSLLGVLCFLCLCCGAFYFWRRYRRTKEDASKQYEVSEEEESSAPESSRDKSDYNMYSTPKDNPPNSTANLNNSTIDHFNSNGRNATAQSTSSATDILKDRRKWENGRTGVRKESKKDSQLGREMELRAM